MDDKEFLADQIAGVLAGVSTFERREIISALICNHGRDKVQDAIKLLTERLYSVTVQSS